MLSGNGQYRLTLHSNGNLYVSCGAQYIWSSNTANSNATKLQFLNDGNVVLAQENGKIVWETNTKTEEKKAIPEKLIIQSDGKLVLKFLDDRVAWYSQIESYECVNGEYINEKYTAEKSVISGFY